MRKLQSLDFQNNIRWFFLILVVNIGLFAFLFYLVVHERKAYLSLRKEGGMVLMESVSHNLEYSILSEEKLKAQLKNNLLNLASYFLKEGFKGGKPDFNSLLSLSRQFNVFKIVVLDKEGNVVFVNRGQFGGRRSFKKEILKVCRGEASVFVIGMRQSYRRNLYRFGVVKSIPGGGALVLMADATYLHRIFGEISFFHVLESIMKYKDVEFIRFEKDDEIVYENYRNPVFKKEIIFFPPQDTGNEFYSRVINLRKLKILEIARILKVQGKARGLLRIGLSLNYIEILDRDFLMLALILILFVVLLDGLFIYSIKQTRKVFEEGEKFRSVIDNIADGIMVKTEEGIVHLNRAVKSLLKDRLEQVLSVPPGSTVLEIDGRNILVSKTIYPFGEVYIIRDITIEEISRKSREREERIFSMGKLVSSFAHEIRNPLNTISMIIQQVVYSKNLSSQEREMLDIVNKEVERLNQIVRDFMKVSKSPDIERESMDIKEFLEEIAVFYRDALSRKGIKLKIEVVENQVLMADKSKLKGVIINLVENAIEAGANEIVLKAVKQDNFLVLSVQDNGGGMDKRLVEQAFDLYFTTKEGGSGLGLPYVQRIVSLHGGFVKVESEKGRGTTFFLYIPAGSSSKEKGDKNEV